MKISFETIRASSEQVREAIDACRADALRCGRTKWLAVRWRCSTRDLLADFIEASDEDAFYWEEPSRGIAILGLGRCTVVASHGPKRFTEASAASSELFGDLVVLDLPGSHRATTTVADCRGPLLMGGFSFSDREIEPGSEWEAFGSGRMVLPALSIVMRSGELDVARTIRVNPESDSNTILNDLCSPWPVSRGLSAKVTKVTPESIAAKPRRSTEGPEIRVRADREHGRYVAQVESALDAIEAGKFEKVVIARSVRVDADRPFDLATFLRSLRTLYPSCALVAVHERGDLFVSASPERLVALDGDRVSAAAIAGSAPRGRRPEEEERYGRALLSSDKERLEHEVVKRAICAALAEPCGRLDGPNEPRLLKLEGIQHLESPLHGRLRPGRPEPKSVLDLVGRLHPTPAVGGAPSAVAVDWLDHFELLDRGWYAGPIGYLDAKGDGEFRVALRSALIRGASARLFAGAGIVAASDPQAELAETRLKLRALLAPLTEI